MSLVHFIFPFIMMVQFECNGLQVVCLRIRVLEKPIHFGFNVLHLKAHMSIQSQVPLDLNISIKPMKIL